MEIYIYEGENLVKVQVSDDFKTVTGEHYVVENFNGKFYDSNGNEINTSNYLSADEKLKLFAESIPMAQKPKATKEGYILKPKYFEGGIAWEFVTDPNYSSVGEGTFTDPKKYIVGLEVTEGLWYTDGENICEAIRSGVPVDFDDDTYFDIIRI